MLGGEDMLPVRVGEDETVADSHHEKRNLRKLVKYLWVPCSVATQSRNARWPDQIIMGSSSSAWRIGGIRFKLSQTKNQNGMMMECTKDGRAKRV